jgi:hypothetical protein
MAAMQYVIVAYLRWDLTTSASDTRVVQYGPFSGRERAESALVNLVGRNDVVSAYIEKKGG